MAVKWLRVLALFPAYVVWRAARLRLAGAALASALASGDETTRLVAGTLLVRAGSQALPLIKTNLERGLALEMSLGLLGDIGGVEALALIDGYLAHADASVAAAAAQARRAAAQAAVHHQPSA